ncbi:MAG: hypothetical protein KIT13_11130, partial [Burkholderiales bacterium]|nr:hypothetical protein [Burkholderiales bacterium]
MDTDDPQSAKSYLSVRFARIWSSISFLLFLVSLMLPAFYLRQISLDGYKIFVEGWAGIFMLDPRWYANLAFFLVLTENWLGMG